MRTTGGGESIVDTLDKLGLAVEVQDTLKAALQGEQVRRCTETFVALGIRHLSLSL
jgi:hypothetical protein